LRKAKKLVGKKGEKEALALKSNTATKRGKKS